MVGEQQRGEEVHLLLNRQDFPYLDMCNGFPPSTPSPALRTHNS